MPFLKNSKGRVFLPMDLQKRVNLMTLDFQKTENIENPKKLKIFLALPRIFC